MAELERANTVITSRGDVEIGITDSIQRHYARHVVQRKPISQAKLDFEHSRPRWLRECLAEATGVFFYGNYSCEHSPQFQHVTYTHFLVYAGISSVAAFTLATGNDLNAPSARDASLIPAFGSFLQIGFAFALGIAFAIVSNCCRSLIVLLGL